MAKIKSIYNCSKCGAQSSKWIGRCLECGSWGTMEEGTEVKKGVFGKEADALPATVTNLSDIEDNVLLRMKTGVSEIDRVFGGGLVPGSLVLLSGEPGMGKSTILAQIADAIAKNKKVIYASGEESASQVKSRLARLDCDLDKIGFIGETDVLMIGATMKKEVPDLVIIDSIQTVFHPEIQSETGSINQIRAAASYFLEIAKKRNITVIMVGHITKDGQVAGPKSLEHIVDTVIYLECETAQDFRILRATKNRFGSTNELGIFEMTGKGLVEIKNPQSIFLAEESQDLEGSVITCVLEGTRPFLVEVQALVTKTSFGYPQRKSSGFDANRLQVLAAVLSKKAGVNLGNQDIILNVVGGLKINDPAIDLAVCLAIASSLLNQKISRETMVFGEVGLGGEVRNVLKTDQRLKEAQKLGFKKAVIPQSKKEFGKIKSFKVANLKDILKYFKK